MSEHFPSARLDAGVATEVRELLQERLVALIDLQLTLKHIHWNVVGPAFIGVHEMLDPWTAKVRDMSDVLAERLTTLGGIAYGTPGFVSSNRSWDDYSIGRDTTQAHLGALDLVLSGVIGDHGTALKALEELDPVSHDVFVNQTGQLELLQWFVRAHIADSSGALPTDDAASEAAAASRAA